MLKLNNKQGFYNFFQQISILTEAGDELSMSLMEPEQKLQTAKQIAGHMPLMDQMIQEINNITKNVIILVSQKKVSLICIQLLILSNS